MDIEINDRLNNLLVEFDKSPLIKEINKLKKEIYKDNNLKNLLEDYKKIDNIYDSKLINIKKEIINNEKIKRFRTLQYELNLLITEINKKLNTLTGKKSCKI